MVSGGPPVRHSNLSENTLIYDNSFILEGRCEQLIALVQTRH
jgi:hypothetical protein